MAVSVRPVIMAVPMRVIMGVMTVSLVPGRDSPPTEAADHAEIRRRAGVAASPSRMCSVCETAWSSSSAT